MTTILKIQNFLKEKNLSNDEFFLLYRKLNEQTGVSYKFIGDLLVLEKKKLIKVTTKNADSDEVNYELRANSSHLFKELDEYMNKTVIETIEDWIQEYRLLFKETGKAGIMGDPNSVRDKMKDFISANPQYSKEIILNAAKKYIKTEAQNYYKYLQRADYFISKEDNNKNKTSRLLMFCEEVGEDNIENDSYNQMI